MRVLLLSNAPYDPPRGGSTRSNLAWLKLLAAAGHECRVVCPSVDEVDGLVDRDAIAIRRVRDLQRQPQIAAEAIREFRPDWVLVTSEDLSHVLLREAGRAAPGRLIYLAHTPQWFPFGPESWNPDPRATEIVRKARAVIAIGHHMAGYIERHTGRPAIVIHPPIYGGPPYRRFGSFGKGTVLMVNPCAVKGIDIFLALAGRFPTTPFAALGGWGLTIRDRDAMAKLPNLRLMGSVPDIEEVLSQARLLLMPSLWYEGFGLIAMEAMLRGLPVISSDSGGLVEAKQGTGFVIPVQPIERYEAVFDENHMPKPVIPPQDIQPWVEALETLLTDRAAYEAESERSRESALRFVESLHPAAFEEMLRSLRPVMRILLAHNSPYYPSHGGGDKSNRLLMEALAARGHTVRVVTRVEKFGPEAHEKLLADLSVRGVEAYATAAGVVRFNRNGVEAHTLTTNPRLRAYFSAQVAEFDPDIILTSTDDPAQLLFEVALQAPRARVVHLARATIALPFGPDSSSPSEPRTVTLRRSDGVVGVSEYVARYVREWGGMDAVHVPISLMESAEPPALGSFDNPYVLMVNPCAVKGISIFLALADQMPHVPFAAVPTWGTNAEDLAALRERPNITILSPSDDIDEILRQARVLLTPSLWAEARSRIIVEAMARGVPVIASGIGGIPEAKLGVDYLIPVRPISGYKPAVDEKMVPIADAPAQDIGPWRAALHRLLTDQDHYDGLAAASRRAALDYIRNLSVEPFEAFLDRITRTPKRAQPPVADGARLSPVKRKLLALRLRRKGAAAASDPWFPFIDPADSATRVFCFPYAGGGALAWRDWRDLFQDDARICPVRLPGRETRLSEPAFDAMDPLVEALADRIRPYVTAPFLFFGHSMGAAIAFELARVLRRRGLPLPGALLVSGARAPQFRLGHRAPPEPREEELLDQLRTLQGVPEDVLRNPELMRMALPALRADTRLYRNYVYLPEAPLSIPIRAYGGETDPNVSIGHLDAWREQTSASFVRREFPGGHFFIHSMRYEFLRAFREDVEQFSACARES